jgi:hypothetical protein
MSSNVIPIYVVPVSAYVPVSASVPISSVLISSACISSGMYWEKEMPISEIYITCLIT